MSQKSQNRKLILQQLLQKSQIFNQYLKNQTNINSILNLSQSKKNQYLHFGKCQIYLPQKVKTITTKFNANKIMVLTKNKKEALRIKQKYQNLQKLKQTQILNNIELTQTQSQRKKFTQCQIQKLAQLQRNNFTQLQRKSCSQLQRRNGEQYNNKRQSSTQMKNFQPMKSIQQSQNMSIPISLNNQINMQSYQFLNDQSYQFSPQRKINISQLKCKTKQFISKNRSNSAKVRPQFDFFLKYNTNLNHTNNITNNINNNLKPDHLGRYNFTPKQQLPISHRKQFSFYKNQIIHTNLYQQYHPTHHNYQNQNNQLATQFQPQQQSTINQQKSTNILTFSSSQPNQSSSQRRASSFSIKKNASTFSPSLLVNKNYQQNIQEVKKNKISFRRQLHKTYKKAFIPPPKITAKSYAVYEVKQQGFQQSGKILATINGKTAQQVASLTKIMTCIVILEISQRFKCDLNEQFVQIGKFQTNITGTSAQIKVGDFYSVNQLLYGLMLPSGNDASLALGVWGGKVLINNETNSQNILNLQYKKYYKKDYIQRFVEQMNLKAQSLNMTRTKYANTHGLVNNQNKSAAIDIALLCQYTMANNKFAQIVNTKIYQSTIKYNDHSVKNPQQGCKLSQRKSTILTSKQPKQRQIKYQNTHYLLHKKPNEYLGIKTGVTTAAGPCLASFIYNKQTKRKFIIVVLDCKSMMMRFKQTQILKKWIYKQQNIPIKIKKFKPRAMSLKQDVSQIRSQLEDTQINSQGDQQYGDEKYQD